MDEERLNTFTLIKKGTAYEYVWLCKLEVGEEWGVLQSNNLKFHHFPPEVQLINCYYD